MRTIVVSREGQVVMLSASAIESVQDITYLKKIERDLADITGKYNQLLQEGRAR